MKGTVLIADDDPEVLETYRTLLSLSHPLREELVATLPAELELSAEEGPFSLVMAHSGKEAIEKHRKLLKSGRRVAAALLDMRMPPGISGLETATYLREQDPNIYIVIITASSDYRADEIQAALQYDLILLSKPVNGEEFRQVTRNAVISYHRFQRVAYPLHYSIVADSADFLAGGQVLVVDNDVMVRKLCQQLLTTQCGYEVTQAESGEQALRLLNRENCFPDLILLDVMMPGMDGYEVCQRLKASAQHAEIPVIFMTARGEEEDVVHGFHIGGADYITKPFSQEVLLARVVTHIRQRRQYLRDQSCYRNSMIKVMRSINEAMLITNHLGQVTLVNEVFERLTGMSRDQLLGRSLSSLFADPMSRDALPFSQQTLQQFSDRLQRLMQEHPRYGKRLIADAPLGVLEVEAESGNLCALNYRAQQQFGQQQEALLQRHLDTLLPGVWSAVEGGQSGVLQSRMLCSKEGEGEGVEEPVTAGYTRISEGERERCFILLRSEQLELDWALVRLTAFGQLFGAEQEAELTQEWALRREQGEDIPVLLQGGVYRDLEHRIEGGVITLVDLRERKRAESQQQHEAFLAGVSEMSATILHNIGNAIQGITSGANQLEGKMQGYQKLIEAVEQFNQQALEPQQRHERDRALLQELPQLLRELVESDNQYSNLNPIEMIQYSAQHVTEIIQMHRRGFRMDLNQVRTALSQLLDDALLLVGNKISCRGIALHKMLQLNGFRDCFLLPKNQLLQALINMLNNAVEAVEEQHPGGGGEIGLQIAAQQPVAEAPIELIVEVSDNGVGIDEKARRKVLQFGYSTKNRGSGFGLHATANFVRNLDGSIEVSSDGVGCGTRVRLRIPVQPG